MRTRGVIALAMIGFGVSPLAAQWSPSGLLAGVPVTEDCDRTAGAPARATEGPQLFTCGEAIAVIDGEVAHAAEFFVVHEYAHIAAENANEPAADCWAAREIGRTPDGAAYVRAIAAWLELHESDYVEQIGLAADRAQRIRECSGLASPPTATSDLCCAATTSCSMGEGTAIPVGTSCYCPAGENDVESGEICVDDPVTTI